MFNPFRDRSIIFIVILILIDVCVSLLWHSVFCIVIHCRSTYSLPWHSVFCIIYYTLQIDVFPTVASLAGVPAPPAYALDGQDVSPLIHQQHKMKLAPTDISGSGRCDGGDEATTALYPNSNYNNNSISADETRSAPTLLLRNYTLSVYPRCPADVVNASNFWANNDCMMTERSAFPFMGISIRTDR